MSTRIAVNGTGVIAYYLGREPRWAHDKYMADDHEYEVESTNTYAYVVGLVAVVIDKDGFSKAYFCDEPEDAVRICNSFAQVRDLAGAP